MKRLGRWLFNLAAVVSLLLFSGTVIMWCRSHSVRDRWSWPGATAIPAYVDWPGRIKAPQGRFIVQSAQGAIEYRIDRKPFQYHAFIYESMDAKLPPRPDGAQELGGIIRNSRFSGLGFVWEEVSGWPIGSSILWHGPGPVPVALERWALPYWAPALVCAAPPVLWSVTTLARRKRARAGRCPACGYDLRATPERCPECGATPPILSERTT